MSAGFRVAWAGTVSVAILAAAGCGSGGESSVPVVSKAVFVRRAKAICDGTAEKVVQEGVPTLRKIEASSGKSGREAEALLVPQWLVPALEEEVEELEAVGLPRGDEGRVEAIFESLDDVIELAKSNPRRYLYLQVSAQHPYKKVERLATAYGISDCGQP